MELDKIGQRYKESLEEHIRNVRIAGKVLEVPGVLLQWHDHSKWEPPEYEAYAKQFKGGGDPERFPRAWLHHIHSNPHHWQHWIFPDGWTMDGSAMDGATVEMPEHYVREMLADWHGASKTYAGCWSIAGWLAENAQKIMLHHKTTDLIHDIMIDLGYVLTDNCLWSFAWLRQDRGPMPCHKEGVT